MPCRDSSPVLPCPAQGTSTSGRCVVGRLAVGLRQASSLACLCALSPTPPFRFFSEFGFQHAAQHQIPAQHQNSAHQERWAEPLNSLRVPCCTFPRDYLNICWLLFLLAEPCCQGQPNPLSSEKTMAGDCQLTSGSPNARI